MSAADLKKSLKELRPKFTSVEEAKREALLAQLAALGSA